jgi:hypothetical protein
MSAEEDEMIFHLRRGRQHQIPWQERKTTSDSMSGEGDEMIFDLRRGR